MAAIRPAEDDERAEQGCFDDQQTAVARSPDLPERAELAERAHEPRHSDHSDGDARERREAPHDLLAEPTLS